MALRKAEAGKIHPLYQGPLIARLASLDELQSRHSLWDVIALNILLEEITPEHADADT